MKKLIVFTLCILMVPFMAMATTDFTNGVSSYGIPLPANDYTTTGDYFFVDSGAVGRKDSVDRGNTPDKPFATLDYAVGRCTAANGDIIFVAPGHAENIAAADSVDADVAGVRIVGLGEEANRPTFTFTGTAGTFAIGAANITIENIRFLAGISAVVIGIAVEAGGDNFTLRNCEFPEPTTSTFEFLDAVDLASGANGVTLDNITFYNMDATGGAHFLDAGNGVNNDIKVLNSLIMGEFSVAALWSDTNDLEVLIDNCNITNATNGQHAIEFTGTATGSIRNTLVRTDVQGTACDPGSMTMANVLWDADASTDTTALPVVLASAGSGSIGAINDTTTDSLHGKIGTDTEMSDGSLYDILLQALQLLGANTAATTDSVHGKLGTDAEFADNSLYDLIGVEAITDPITDILSGTAGMTTWKAGAAAANTVSMAEALRYAQENVIVGTGTALPANMSLYGVLAGATGIAAFPASALPANDVSMAEVLRETYDQAEKSVSGSTAVIVNADTLFTIANGPIEILSLVSVCIALNDATDSTLQYSADPTVGAATTFSGASASLANAAAGSGVVLNMTALATAPDLIDPFVGLTAVHTRGIVVNAGIITAVVGVGSTTGTWKHYLRYRPLDRGVTVTGT